MQQQTRIRRAESAPAARALATAASNEAALVTPNVVVAGAGNASSMLQRLRNELREAHRANNEDAARDLYDRWLGEDPFEGRDAISVAQARLRLIAFVFRRATTVKTPWIHVAGGILEQAEIDRFAQEGEGAAERPSAQAA